MITYPVWRKLMRAIFFLLVSVLLPLTNANAAKQVAIFVNGYNDCCADRMGDVQATLADPDLHIEQFNTPWNSLSAISGATSQNQAGKVTVGATQNFVDQMNTYFSGLPDGSEVYLFGHSFGGDSILQFLAQNGRTRIKIRLVALLDPVEFDKLVAFPAVVGLRPIGFTIPSNVDYFFNRWQRNDGPPTNFLLTGRIDCNAKTCNQGEQSIARNVNGETLYITCKAYEITCPGYVPPIPFYRN